MAPYQELLQVTHRFFYCLDEGRYGELLALMSPEAVWHRQGRILRGHRNPRRARALQHQRIRRHHEHSSTGRTTASGARAYDRIPLRRPADFFNPGPERHPGDIEPLLIAAWQEEDA
jgi:hypothetical protein